MKNVKIECGEGRGALNLNTGEPCLVAETWAGTPPNRFSWEAVTQFVRYIAFNKRAINLGADRVCLRDCIACPGGAVITPKT